MENQRSLLRVNSIGEASSSSHPLPEAWSQLASLPRLSAWDSGLKIFLVKYLALRRMKQRQESLIDAPHFALNRSDHCEM